MTPKKSVKHKISTTFYQDIAPIPLTKVQSIIQDESLTIQFLSKSITCFNRQPEFRSIWLTIFDFTTNRYRRGVFIDNSETKLFSLTESVNLSACSSKNLRWIISQGETRLEKRDEDGGKWKHDTNFIFVTLKQKKAI